MLDWLWRPKCERLDRELREERASNLYVRKRINAERQKDMDRIRELEAENRALKVRIVSLTRRLETERQMRAWLDRGDQTAELAAKLLKVQEISRGCHRQIRKLRLDLEKANRRVVWLSRSVF